MRYNPCNRNPSLCAENAHVTLEKDPSERERERDHIFEFLMGLNDEFGTVRTQILSVKSVPSLGTMYHIATEDEQQRSITTSRKAIVEVVAKQI